MSTAAPDKLMTLEEFDALPEDQSVERMLIRGVLWEKPMTWRNKWHATTESRLSFLLTEWALRQPEGRFIVASGEAGCILRRSPATRVGIDAAVFSAEAAALDDEQQVCFSGPPILAVEVLSPSDQQSEVQSKVREYLASGVLFVWIVDTHFQTVIVHRPDGKPEMFTTDEELVGDPHLPGLRIPVQRIFAH